MKRLCLALLVLLLAGLACALPAGLGASADTTQTLQNLDAGLDQLKSYRLSLKLRFTGQAASSAAGQDQTVIIDTLEEFGPAGGAESGRHFLLITSTTASRAELPNLPGALEFYEVGGRVFTLSTAEGNNPLCREGQAGAQSGLAGGSIFDLLPQLVLQSFTAAQRVPPAGQQSESINGIAVDHYRLDATTSEDGQSQLEGDLWVAQSGGYVVRFTGALQGPVAINLLNGSGLLGWEYNLSDANSLTGIAVPEQCQALGQSGLPLPNNAADIQQTSSGLSFSSPATPQELLQFYQASLPQQGWTIDAEGGDGANYLLKASRENQTISITIQSAPGPSLVTIETITGP